MGEGISSGAVSGPLDSPLILSSLDRLLGSFSLLPLLSYPFLSSFPVVGFLISLAGKRRKRKKGISNAGETESIRLSYSLTMDSSGNHFTGRSGILSFESQQRNDHATEKF